MCKKVKPKKKNIQENNWQANESEVYTDSFNVLRLVQEHYHLLAITKNIDRSCTYHIK